MRVFVYTLFLSLLFILNINEAARILVVVPTPSISHQVVFRVLTQELARRGHDVTFITTDPAFPKGGAPANLTEIDLHDLSYNLFIEESNKVPRGNKEDMITMFRAFFKFWPTVFGEQLKDASVQRLIKDKNQKFDLLILEAGIRQALVFSHIFKAPVIQMSSFGGYLDNFPTIGAPTHLFLYPTVLQQKIHNLTMYGKIMELYKHYTIESLYYESRHLEDKVLREIVGPDVPSVTELANNVDMLFLNVNPVFVGIRPVPPTVVFTNGLHQIPPKELPKDLKSYLDSSKKGVIYISFGTNVDPTLLPAERIQVLVKAFSQLPYDVLWKWNGDELPGRTENIRISKWLPQSDLLRHPKIKVFVTQGGLQSTDEAITAGVPLIGIPMLGDQWFNVEKYLTHNIGVGLDLDDITVESFKNTLLKVIQDDSYRQSIVKLRRLMRDEFQSPLERAVWWTEYVLRHGGAKHLRSPAANISWAEYLELELVLTLLAGLLVVVSAFIFITYKLFKYISKKCLISVKVKSS
ncbi:UDP-glucuronosyltransferase 2B20-like [Trichoplusia ni]|uniref:UDP-glucuronosyltransferase n=1 Tax=Trichoplusia ni TaxID=7111 RepID=A0A7E5W4Z7_TRINI|nr:UDP-glucuronosyltransferase 2B20-like [Trichoplusia ni]